jgi:CheY-like chemotaxis protein
MDVRMPEMDGLQATRAIRARGERRSAVPVIAFTANAFPEDVKVCREAGMNDFVVKPARKKDMVEAILRILPEPAMAMDMPAEPPTPSLAPAAIGSTISPATLDREVFDELTREIGEQDAAELLMVFTEETEIRLKLLRKFSIDLDRAKIGREAHSLKSGAGTFGYRELAGLANALEQNAARLAAGDYRKLLDRMDAAYHCATALELQR